MEGRCAYDHIDACDETRNVDLMLQRWQHERELLVKTVLEAPSRLPETWKKVLSVDRACKVRLGQGELWGFGCAMCKNIGRLTRLRPELFQNPFCLECGKKEGQYLILRAFPQALDQNFLRVSGQPRLLAQSLLQQCADYTRCEPQAATSLSLNYLCSDNFTNDTLIGYLVATILQQQQFCHHLGVETAFYCGNDGYHLMEYPTLGGISNIALTPLLAEQIVLQLLITLDLLAPYQFTYGNPQAASLVFLEEPCSFPSLRLNAPLSLKLYNFSYAGLSIQTSQGPTRLYSSNAQSEPYERGGAGIPIPRLVTREEQGVSYYLINDETEELFLQLQNLGVPLYTRSFDAYCFLLGLMVWTKFAEAVLASPRAAALWQACWHPQDYAMVMKSLVEGPRDEYLSTGELIKYLKYRRLRCDLVPHLLTLARSTAV